MSPERIDSKRYSKGWRKHLKAGRTAANKKRRDSLTPEQKQRQMTAASWSAVKGLIKLQTFNNPYLQPLYDDPYRMDIVRSWYDASYRDATTGDGKGQIFRDRFRRFSSDDIHDPNFDPRLRLVQPFMAIVDQALFKAGRPIKK
ncbi:MAG: hypothetical protein COU25_00265 [Candidatus Levybacteria bacterium CG10_big_fil_rev_8_21_14_0_10_35_13]|nr:MAG: hypothetical protein COU25_00265 [Candidatus Levybacteria bacterium CG10_big_fil_rev_8_21_14_0_10_35_13]